MGEGVLPVIVVITPSQPEPGSVVDVGVTFDKIASSNQTVAISGAPAGFFSFVPSQVTLQAGRDELTFQATLSATATGGGSITASCNGGSATGHCQSTVID